MGRKLGFDSEKVLGKAMMLFWRVGYKKASTQQLMQEMGLGQGSFYNSFKSKKQLYLRCLKHYNTRITYVRTQTLESSVSVKKGLRRFFGVIFSELSDRKNPHTCLMTNSLSYEVLEKEDLKKYIVEEMNRFRRYLESKLRQAVKSGELSKTLDPATVSQIIITYIQGLFKMSMISTDIKPLEKQTNKFLESIGL